MELRHLRYFLAASQTESFTAAAASCQIAPSALNEQIGRLEAELGTVLFHRTVRRVSLTPAGELLRPLAARILAGAEQARDEVAGLGGLRGRVRLGTIQLAPGDLSLTDTLGLFAARHPNAEVHVLSDASLDLTDAVARGDLEVAIVSLGTGDAPAGLTQHPIVDDPIVAVLSAEAGDRAPDPITLAELVDRGPFIHFMPGSGLREVVATAFQRAGLKVQPAFELDQVDDMVRLAAAGVGVTAVPSASVRRAVADHSISSIATCSLADDQAVLRVGVVYDPHRLSAAAAAFLDVLPLERDVTEATDVPGR